MDPTTTEPSVDEGVDRGPNRALAFVRRQPTILLGLVIFAIFFARGVVTEEEIARNRWTEYLVFDLASTRMRDGANINVSTNAKVAEDVTAAETAEFEERLGVDVHPKLGLRLALHAYSYPPLLAFLVAPISSIGDHDFEMMIWYVVIFWLEVFAVWGAIRLVFPPGDEGVSQRARRVLIAASLVACLRYLLAPIENQQVDSIIFAAFVGGGLVLSRGMTNGRQVLSGLLFG
ncbi:MAG: glycosyltransferase 87 family protein, partial [Planctomycetota bacterium]